MNIYQQFQQTGNVTHLSLSPDDKLLLGQTSRGDVTVWRLADGKQLAHWTRATKVPARLGLDANGYFIITAKQEGIAIKRLVGKDENWITLKADHNIGQLLLHPDGHTLLTVKTQKPPWFTRAWHRMPLIQFWDLTTGKCIHHIHTNQLINNRHIVRVEAATTSNWSDLAVMINYFTDLDKFVLRIYPLKENGVAHFDTDYDLDHGRLQSIQQLAFSEDGQLLTVAIEEHWKTENYMATYTRNRPIDKDFSSSKSEIKLFSSTGGGPIPNYELKKTSVKQLLTANDGLIIVYDDARQTIVWRGEASMVSTLPSGLENPSSMHLYDQDRTLVIGNKRGEMRWYTLPDLEPIATKQEHQGAVQCLVATKTGHFLVSGDIDGRINVWTTEATD